MIWVGWRQQRAEAAIVAAMLAALAAVLLPTGLNVASAFDAGHLASCTGATTSPSCQQAVDQFLVRFNGLGGLIALLTLIPGFKSPPTPQGPRLLSRRRSAIPRQV